MFTSGNLCNSKVVTSTKSFKMRPVKRTAVSNPGLHSIMKQLNGYLTSHAVVFRGLVLPTRLPWSQTFLCSLSSNKIEPRRGDNKNLWDRGTAQPIGINRYITRRRGINVSGSSWCRGKYQTLFPDTENITNRSKTGQN